MAKVLFINPLVREEDDPKHIPMGIAQLCSIIMEKGHLVQVFDQNAWRVDDETIVSVLKSDKWDIVAIGGITTAYSSIKKIIKLTRTNLKDTVIALGGGVLSSMPKDILRWIPEIDIGIIGESYVTFPEVLSMIDSGKKDWEKIPGVISRSENGFVFSEQRNLIHNLDSLPYPAYELFPVKEVYFKNSALMYSEEGMKATRRLDINGSIGCSLVCKFCYHLGIAGDMKYKKDISGNVVNVEFDTKNNYTRSIRYHSPEYIVNLVLYLKKKYDVNFINFLDENLMTMDVSSKRTWLKEICRLWKEAGLVPKKNKDGTWKGVHWSGTSHATLCNKEVLKMMADHGCSHLVYGYESFDDRILKTIGKGATVKTNLRSFFWTLESGIRPIPCQMFGFPDDDFESIRKNMRAWDELGIVVKPTFATAYPGSEWYTKYKDKILEQYKGVGKKMGLSDDLEAYIVDLGDATRVTGVISKNFNSVELIGLREMMLQKQYHKVDEYEAVWKEKNKDKINVETDNSQIGLNENNLLNVN